jgi:hypothetical protein
VTRPDTVLIVTASILILLFVSMLAFVVAAKRSQLRAVWALRNSRKSAGSVVPFPETNNHPFAYASQAFQSEDTKPLPTALPEVGPQFGVVV